MNTPTTTTTHEGDHAMSETTKPVLRIAFDDSQYRINHGKAPHGSGGWAFAEKRNPDVSTDTILWAPGPLTLTQAKKWAKAEVARLGGQGYVTLHVLP